MPIGSSRGKGIWGLMERVYGNLLPCNLMDNLEERNTRCFEGKVAKAEGMPDSLEFTIASWLLVIPHYLV